ncbi:MAG: hypothetical protein U0U66_02895 [Cytophagaceae bacterium]
MKNRHLQASIILTITLLGLQTEGFTYHFEGNQEVYSNIVNQQSVQIEVTKVAPTGGQANGKITVTVVKGTGPYKITAYGTSLPQQTISFEKSYTLSNLSSGDYLIVVSDASKAFVSENVTL